MADHDRDPDEEVIFRVLTGRGRDTEEEHVAAWRRRAPANEAHYHVLAGVLGLAARADAPRYRGDVPPAREVVAQAAIAAGRRSTTRRRRRVRRWLPGGLAAAAAAILVGLGLPRVLPDAAAPSGLAVEEFVTGPSDAATVGLRDGTVIRLAPMSRLSVLGDQAGRAVAMTGRAYFTVAKDETRPFRVQTPAGVIRVLGTRFDVEAGGDDLRVVVVEGSVALAVGDENARLESGEIGRVIRGKPVPVTKVADPEAHVEWVGRFLAFQETPLRDAAREIGNKYGVTIELGDSALAERTITAWFADWTLAEVLDVVCPVVHAECAIEGDVVNAMPRER